MVVLKTGRHPDAQRAAASHTAALSGDAAVIYAALRQAGVHLVEDGLTLLEVAASLDRQPPLRGRKIGIITNSGGAGVELTDLLEFERSRRSGSVAGSPSDDCEPTAAARIGR